MNDPAIAGFSVVTCMVLFAGVGAGLGAIIGAVFPLAILGVFVGFAIGFRLVYARFKDL